MTRTMTPTTMPAMMPPLWVSKVDLAAAGAGAEVGDGVVNDVEEEEDEEDADEDEEVVEKEEEDTEVVRGAGELVANAPWPVRIKEGVGYESVSVKVKPSKAR